jgi:thymidylate synthase (FAD)
VEVILLNPEDCTNAFEKIGRFAAVCKGGTNYEAIGKQCLESGHWSAVRTVQLNFHVRGISRACSHQLVRHKIGVEINQQSQRSVVAKWSKDYIGTVFIIPSSIYANLSAKEAFTKLCWRISKLYDELIAKGIPVEDARYVLPQAVTTELNIQFSLQALVHFCHERLCQKAQWEIRELAQKICEEVEKANPELAKYLVPKCEYLSYCPEKNSCGRYLNTHSCMSNKSLKED